LSPADDPLQEDDPGTPNSGSDTLESPDPGATATIDVTAAPTPPKRSRSAHPESIGPYRLLKKLGEGGMGQVWLAEQTTPVHRQVALKLIKTGTYDFAVLQRFQSERQSLAIMDHPSIAKVFDAGTTPEGQPYFVMEYVPGLQITKYCDQKQLKIPERLELFIKVCEGVQHAHQKAIMHRDLKPANILVVEVDGQPTPRIIDFGLAKATATQEPGEEMLTRAGTSVGTLGYMSPEQADPSVEDVDTRTDVYSLGAVLYVLLTGSLPFDAQQWRKQPFHDVLKQLREDDPPRPSTKVSSDRASLTTRAGLRRTDPQHLLSLLRGDLDWIAMKALERDRTRRYGTPSELAADIRRYLQHEPVVARPASPGYRLRKYVRRHRIGVTVAAGLVALLAGFAVMQVLQVRRITRERDRADRIAALMTNMFKVSNPSESRGNTVTAREILDKGSQEITSALSKDPDLQVKMLATIGNVYLELGLFSRSQQLLEQAVATGRRALGTANQATLDSMSNLSFLWMREGRYAEAEKLLRDTIDGQKRVFGPKSQRTLASMRYLASVLEAEGRFADADKLQRDALAVARTALGPENSETLQSMNVMANILDDEERYQEAEKLYRETAEIQRRKFGPDFEDTMTTMSNLGGVLEEEGRLGEAEKIQRETLALRSKVLGPGHPDTLAVKMNLGNTLNRAGRLTEAEQLYRETLEAQEKAMGRDNPDTLVTMTQLGMNLRQEGRFAEAEQLLKEALDRKKRVLGPDHPETIKSIEELASTLSSEKKYTEVLPLYDALVQKAKGPTAIAGAWYNFACGAALAGHPDEAFQHLDQAIGHGYNDARHLAQDDDLQSLRSDPRFAALIQQLSRKTPAAQ
jgi:eukaryotic-like serine/threonine-protein kinase